MDPLYPLVPVANFLACFLVIISLTPGMFRYWNIGVWMSGLWIAVQGFSLFVNSIVWKDNVENVAPVWCDITTHLGIGFVIGAPACTFVITRRLYKITCLRASTTSKTSKRREVILDLALCLGLPIIAMVLYYVVQEFRFAIWEELGCLDSEGPSGVSVLLINAWAVILPLISAIFYCPRVIWTFYHQRREMNEYLDSNASINRSSYHRMLALGCLDAAITLPLTALNLIQEVLQPSFVFYQGWTIIHTAWAPIVYPKSAWKNFTFWTVFNLRFDQWITPFFALIFFLLFGTTKAARSQYSRMFWFAVKPFGIKRRVNKEISDTMVFRTADFNPESSTTTNQGHFVDRSLNEDEAFANLPETEKGSTDFSDKTQASLQSLNNEKIATGEHGVGAGRII